MGTPADGRQESIYKSVAVSDQHDGTYREYMLGRARKVLQNGAQEIVDFAIRQMTLESHRVVAPKKHIEVEIDGMVSHLLVSDSR